MTVRSKRGDVDASSQLQRLTLVAVVSDKVVPPLDEATRQIEPLPGVQTLVHATSEGKTVPVVLSRDRFYWPRSAGCCANRQRREVEVQQ